jgi:hypothetical protein
MVEGTSSFGFRWCLIDVLNDTVDATSRYTRKDRFLAGPSILSLPLYFCALFPEFFLRRLCDGWHPLRHGSMGYSAWLDTPMWWHYYLLTAESRRVRRHNTTNLAACSSSRRSHTHQVSARSYIYIATFCRGRASIVAANGSEPQVTTTTRVAPLPLNQGKVDDDTHARGRMARGTLGRPKSCGFVISCVLVISTCTQCCCPANPLDSTESGRRGRKPKLT